MVSSDVSRDNFRYASYLRSRGFPTAVHALPQEAINLVNELLGKGWKGQRVSNEINRLYGDQLLAMNLKRISRFAINTYREKYWKLSPALSNLILLGDEKTKQEITVIKESYDAYRGMLRKTFAFDKLVDKAYELTANYPLPPISVVNLVTKSYYMHRDNLREQVKLGIWNPPMQEKPELTNNHSQKDIWPWIANLSKKELNERLTDMVCALTETGIYAPVKLTGEDMSCQNKH